MAFQSFPLRPAALSVALTLVALLTGGAWSVVLAAAGFLALVPAVFPLPGAD